MRFISYVLIILIFSSCDMKLINPFMDFSENKNDKNNTDQIPENNVFLAWTLTYPKTSNISETSFDLNISQNEDGKAYYIVVTDGAASPASTDVVSGSNYDGVTVIKSGNLDVTSDTESIVNISSLSASTSYDVYVVGEDVNSNVMNTPAKLDVTTTNTAAFSWNNTYPKISNILETSLNLSVSQTEDGNVYFIIVLDGETSPTSTQVKNGVNYGDVVLQSQWHTAITKDSEYVFSILSLTSNTNYDLYVVGEDNNGDLMISPAKIDFSTL